MVDLLVTSVIPLSIFVGLPVLLWLLFMALRWYRGYRAPREWLKRQSESSGQTSSESLSSPTRLSVADLAAEGKRSTCAACHLDYWYEGGELRKELSPRPWQLSSRQTTHVATPQPPPLRLESRPPPPPSSSHPSPSQPKVVFRL